MLFTIATLFALLASLCTVAEFVIGMHDRAQRRGRRRKLRRKREGRMHQGK